MATTSTIAGTRVPRTVRRRLQAEWFSNTRADVLSGLVVALALIPEAIAFSIIAGVDPKVGLYASFSIAVITALVGGRPGMISAATAAVAVLVVPLVREHGVDYLFAATILMGWLGPNELAAHAIALQCAALAFMVLVFVLLFFDHDGRIALIVGAVWFALVIIGYFVWSRAASRLALARYAEITGDDER